MPIGDARWVGVERGRGIALVAWAKWAIVAMRGELMHRRSGMSEIRGTFCAFSGDDNPLFVGQILPELRQIPMLRSWQSVANYCNGIRYRAFREGQGMTAVFVDEDNAGQASDSGSISKVMITPLGGVKRCRERAILSRAEISRARNTTW